MADPLARYATQIRVARIGEPGQARLVASRAVVVGVGALGSTIADQLVRGGVGTVVLVDPDRVELGNLHRQSLYTEDDAAAARPKVEAAARRLAEANRGVRVITVRAPLDRDSGPEILSGADVVVDGTDNMRARFAINELCASTATPWVYGGVAATHGMVMPVLPGVTACLRCLFEEPGTGDEVQTAETVGVLGPAPAAVGALEAAAAMRILVGDLAAPTRLLSVDVWTGSWDAVVVHPDPGCPVCEVARSAAKARGTERTTTR